MTDLAHALTSWWSIELQQEINQWVLLGMVGVFVAGVFVLTFEKRGS
jgi:lipid-A-disaccharide synthase-like uncharacterized protein